MHWLLEYGGLIVGIVFFLVGLFVIYALRTNLFEGEPHGKTKAETGCAVVTMVIISFLTAIACIVAHFTQQ